VKPVIARRCTDHGSELGRVRWVVVLVRLAAQLPPAPHPLGTRRRPALRAPEPRMPA
jgi:hypothetical protein